MRRSASVLGSGVLAACAASWVIACSDPGNPNGGSGGNSSAASGGTNPVGSGGNDGDGGTIGTAGESSMEYPGFSLAEVPADFSACGGEPFGIWNSTSVGWTSWQGGLGNQVVTEGAYRMMFVDGGHLVFWRDDALVVKRFGSTCPGDGGLVIDFDPKEPEYDSQCGYAEDGECLCFLTFEELYTTGSWTRTSTTLTVTVDDHDPITYDYCIDGDEMMLVGDDGRTITMEHVFAVETPVPCDGRLLVECSGVCVVGKCIGDASCETSFSESECLTHAGCSWDPEQCSGGVQSQCTFYDFDNVPGCDFVAAAHCEGTPDPCWTIAESSCDEQLGCVAESWCNGEPIPCSSADYLDMPCADLTGCARDEDTYECVGPDVLCTSFGDRCNLEGYEVGCDEYPCSGEPTSCAEHDTLTCGSIAGCTVVVDAP